MSGSKKPPKPRVLKVDPSHDYRIEDIKPLIGKHVGPVTGPQIREFCQMFPGLDKDRQDATKYIKKMQKGEWFAETSKSAKEALERCPVESQPMFKDYHVYAEATGNVTFPDAWQSGDFHALWVGLHGWQEWKDDPKNGGYAGDNGWYRHGARLLCRVQAYYVEQKIRCYKSKDDYLKRKLGTRAAEAGQLGCVNEKPEDHLDMLEIVTIAPKTGTKRKHNTSERYPPHLKPCTQPNNPLVPKSGLLGCSFKAKTGKPCVWQVRLRRPSSGKPSRKNRRMARWSPVRPTTR